MLNEEERIQNILKDLRDRDCITEELYQSLRPRGSQPPRLYGLAKVHKQDIPMRPVLSMPGSAYHKVGCQVAKWLSIVPECNINTSTKTVRDSIKDIQIEDDEELVSFDVCSLYTNVPVKEAIDVCTDLLFKQCIMPIDRETFKTLAEIASCNVILSTHDGFYQQIDGLAMGSPPAPHLANGWLSTFDSAIQGSSSLYSRYMDDVFKKEKSVKVEDKLDEINTLHPSLTFTCEREKEGKLSHLDMEVIRKNKSLESTWYRKPTDTGLILNYHSLAPKRYKRSIVSGFVHRIHRSCSNIQLFEESLEKAKKTLEMNQYPPQFYEPIISETLEKIRKEEEKDQNDVSTSSEEDTSLDIEDNSIIDPNACQHQIDDKDKFLLFVQYRGKTSEEYASALHRINAPCRIVFTLRKLSTVLPSRKPSVETMIRSNVVYKITCPQCKLCYVGQTCRQLQCRFREHASNKGPVKTHFHECNTEPREKDVDILAYTSRGMKYLLTLEALFINDIRPSLNTKDEFRSRTLTIKF